MENLILTTFTSDELRKLIKDSITEVLAERFPVKEETEHTKLMSVKETSELLKISVQTIYGYTAKRLIPFAKKGKRLYFNSKELLAWVQEGKIKTQAEIEQIADEYILRKKLKR